VYRGSRRAAALVVLAASAALTLGACGSASDTSAPPLTKSPVSTSSNGSSDGSSDASSTSPSAPSSDDTPTDGGSGVTVSGDFGSTPKVTIPSTAAPTTLTEQVLSPGTGKTLAAGDTLVANYVGETWASGKVFDSSFSRGEPAGFVIGEGQVIPGWDKTLVGQKLGSRVLLTIPPADGYGASGNSQAGISGTDTLVFVVDLVAAYPSGASAPGTVAGSLPAGWPQIDNTPAKEPKITSVAGVKAPKSPTSQLLVKGSGDPIDPSKTLVLQLVETDLATGKKTQSTWSQAPDLVAASNVTQVASALKGQNVGARAVALLPATPATPASDTSQGQPATPAEVLVIDVVGQF
jgi:peptidylprolyl isomerase